MIRKSTVLVVDDDDSTRSYLASVLPTLGYDARCVESGEKALAYLAGSPAPAAVLLDLVMPGMGGLETLDRIKRLHPAVGVIVLSTVAEISSVVDAVRRGAADYLSKTFEDQELGLALQNVVEKQSLKDEVAVLRRRLDREDGMVTSAPRLLRIKEIGQQVADTDAPVLILGQSGVGKEVVARYIHGQSRRRGQSFVKVNCAALPEDLLESELFGHERGAFSGALTQKPGLFEQADGGTILLDEIGEMTFHLQAKLLHVLQDGEYTRLGGRQTVKVDARVMASTNVQLDEAVAAGRFREDLFYRLHVININLPPLRERKDDIPYLAQHFLEKFGAENNRSDLELTPEALDLMMDYDWPGNVRELENVMERAVVLSSGHRIGAELIPDHVRSAPVFHIPRFVVPPEGISFKDVITNVEKRLIESTLEAAGGVQKRAAELLKIKPTTLNEMIKRYEIGTRRKKIPNEEGSSESSRSRPFPAAELTRD